MKYTYMFKEPILKDFEKYKTNILVNLGLNGKCYTNKSMCIDTDLTGGQKIIGDCGNCKYFLGYRSTGKLTYFNLPACCWAKEQ